MLQRVFTLDLWEWKFHWLAADCGRITGSRNRTPEAGNFRIGAKPDETFRRAHRSRRHEKQQSYSDSECDKTEQRFLYTDSSMALPFWFSEGRWAARALLLAVIDLKFGLIPLKTLRVIKGLSGLSGSLIWRRLLVLLQLSPGR